MKKLYSNKLVIFSLVLPGILVFFICSSVADLFEYLLWIYRLYGNGEGAIDWMG